MAEDAPMLEGNRWYAAPTLILRHVLDHVYLPPAESVEAVLGSN